MANELTVKQKQDNLVSYIDQNKNSIFAAMPKHMDSDRMLRILLTCVRTTPKLAECTIPSVMASVMNAVQMGFIPGDGTGRAYLIPYKTECTLIVGYKGLIHLARQSGEIAVIQTQIVYKDDDFKIDLGTDAKIHHIPGANFGRPGTDNENIIGAYATVKYKDGWADFEYMNFYQINQIRKRSMAKNYGPWVTDFEEMARKTPLRRLLKRQPVSIELAKVINTEDEAIAKFAEKSCFDDPGSTHEVVDGSFEEMGTGETSGGEGAAAVCTNPKREGKPITPEWCSDACEQYPGCEALKNAR